MVAGYSQYKVGTRFLDMIEMSCGTADRLYSSLKRVLEEKNKPLQNLVGYSSDTLEHISVEALYDVIPLKFQEFFKLEYMRFLLYVALVGYL